MISSNPPECSTQVLISIIVPTYNSEKYIRRCLDSLRNQTFQDYQLVIVDGGSTDGTLQEVARQAPHFAHIISQSEKDRGVYDAMNKGVALARGEWLLFLGSDDVLHRADVLAEIAPQLSPDCDFVYGNVYAVTASSWVAAGGIYDGQFDDDKILERNICHQAIFYSRTLFVQYGGYNLTYRVLADWEFNLRVFRSAKKKYVDIIVADFEGGGLSTTALDYEFNLRFTEIVDRSFRLPLRASFYQKRLTAVGGLAYYHWKRRRRLHSLRYFWIWMINLKLGDLPRQLKNTWVHRHAALGLP